jgi:3-oxoacyl-[acyl-carrier-protein] synthase-3
VTSSSFGKNIGIALGSKVFNVKKICEKKFGKKKTLEIIKKTGPIKTFQCTKNEDTLTLSLRAWKNFKKKNKISKINKIKNLIYVTETNRFAFPGNGYLFSSMTNLKEETNIYDINSGCTGFVDALKVANKLSGNTLIVCSEAYSKNIKKFDRSISTLFSDGASVFFFEKEKFSVLKEISIFKKNSFLDLSCSKNKIEMEGKKVYDFVVSHALPKIENFLKENKLVKKIFFHQASQIVGNYIKNKFKKKTIRIPHNLLNRGNTVSATIPILIHDYTKKEILNVNDTIMLVGFGVGLSMSAITLKILK